MIEIKKGRRGPFGELAASFSVIGIGLPSAGQWLAANYTKAWGSAFWSGQTMALIMGAVLFFILEYDKRGEKAFTGAALSDR